MSAKKFVSLKMIEEAWQKLMKEFPEFILGQPAIFGQEETEFSKGYSKGFYDVKDAIDEWKKKVGEFGVLLTQHRQQQERALAQGYRDKWGGRLEP